jgi:hypothetical protein
LRQLEFLGKYKAQELKSTVNRKKKGKKERKKRKTKRKQPGRQHKQDILFD